MTLEALKTILDTTGLPVSYSSVPLDEAKRRPYICYSQEDTNPFSADGIVYYSAKVMSVKLYTDKRDEAAEAKVENAIKDIFYRKAPAFLSDQKIYEISYEFEV